MADRLASEEGREKLEDADLAAALADFVPSRNALYIEFMEVLAAFEAGSAASCPSATADSPAPNWPNGWNCCGQGCDCRSALRARRNLFSMQVWRPALQR